MGFKIDRDVLWAKIVQAKKDEAVKIDRIEPHANALEKLNKMLDNHEYREDTLAAAEDRLTELRDTNLGKPLGDLVDMLIAEEVAGLRDAIFEELDDQGAMEERSESRQAGFNAGLTGKPFECPPDVDKTAWELGYEEGKRQPLAHETMWTLFIFADVPGATAGDDVISLHDSQPAAEAARSKALAGDLGFKRVYIIPPAWTGKPPQQART
jgi:hypothetical protein